MPSLVAPAPPASGWELPDDESGPPDAEWEAEAARPVPPLPAPSSPEEAAATVPDLSAAIRSLLPDTVDIPDVGSASLTPAQVKATLPSWESEETPAAPAEPLSALSGQAAGGTASDPASFQPIELARPSHQVQSPIASLVLDDDMTAQPEPLPPATTPRSLSELVAADRTDDGDAEADVLGSPFMAPAPPSDLTPLPLAPPPPPAHSDGDHISFGSRERVPSTAPPPAPSGSMPLVMPSVMPSVMVEGAPLPEAVPVFPPPLLTSDMGSAPLDGRPQTQPARLGWIWAGAIAVLGSAALFLAWPRTPEPVPPPAAPVARPPAPAPQPTIPAPAANKPAGARPATLPSDPTQRLIFAARQATIEGNKRQALKLFKAAYKVNAKDPGFAIYVPMARGKTGKATIVLEGKGSVTIDGHKFDSPQKLTVAAGPHTVELAGQAWDITVEKDATQRVSTSAGTIGSAPAPATATSPRPAPAGAGNPAATAKPSAAGNPAATAKPSAPANPAATAKPPAPPTR